MPCMLAQLLPPMLWACSISSSTRSLLYEVSAPSLVSSGRMVWLASNVAFPQPMR